MAWSGKQYKGASKARRELKREEAEARQAASEERMRRHRKKQEEALEDA